MAEQPDRSAEGVVEVSVFDGLINTVAPSRMPLGGLVRGENVDATDERALLRRRGHSASLLAGSSHSLWSDGRRCFVVVSGVLREVLTLSPTFSSVARHTLADAELNVEFMRAGGVYYYSNGVENGCIDGTSRRSWGVPVPGFSLLPVTGSLRAGSYAVAVADRVGARESGASVARAEVSLGGVQVTLAPAAPGVTSRRVYLSHWDGEQVYLAAVLPSDGLAVTLTQEPVTGAQAPNLHLSPPPVGQTIARYSGHALVAAGDTLFVSPPFQYELFDLRNGFRFSDRITGVVSMDDGVFVSAGGIYWLAGPPSEWSAVQVYTDPFSEGGWCRAPAADNGPPPAAFAMVPAGVIELSRGGSVRVVTGSKYSFGLFDRAAAAVRGIRGFHQVIFSGQDLLSAPNVFS